MHRQVANVVTVPLLGQRLFSILSLRSWKYLEEMDLLAVVKLQLEKCLLQMLATVLIGVQLAVVNDLRSLHLPLPLRMVSSLTSLPTYVVKSPLVTMAHPIFAPKVPIPVHQSPNPTTCLILGPMRLMMPNGIRIRYTVFPQCTGQSDPHTYTRDAQTDRSCTGKFDDYRPLHYESNTA